MTLARARRFHLGRLVVPRPVASVFRSRRLRARGSLVHGIVGFKQRIVALHLILFIHRVRLRTLHAAGLAFLPARPRSVRLRRRVRGRGRWRIPAIRALLRIFLRLPACPRTRQQHNGNGHSPGNSPSNSHSCLHLQPLRNQTTKWSKNARSLKRIWAAIAATHTPKTSRPISRCQNTFVG